MTFDIASRNNDQNGDHGQVSMASASAVQGVKKLTQPSMYLSSCEQASSASVCTTEAEDASE